MARKDKYAPMQECKQAIVFARVSSREQEQGSSTESQLKIMKDYCEKYSLKVIKIYNLTESSTNGERKKFWEMITFIKSQKKKTAIIVHCIDRLQRGYKECVEVENLLTKDVVEVHFLKEGLTLHKESSSSDIMRYDMGVLSAKMYIGSMRDNVKRSLNFNRDQGKWQSFAPIGYLNTRDISDRATIIVDDERAPIVVKLFEAYATGMHSLKSLHVLVQQMNLCSRQRKGVNIKPITRANLHNVLQNPFYYGVMKTKGELRAHIYPAIIDKELFDRVQYILGGGKPQTTRVHGEIPFALSGLIRCSTCGCAITPEQHTKKSGKQYIYLRCSHLKGDCNQGIVNENIIFEQLENDVFQKMSIPTSMLSSLKDNVKIVVKKDLDINASIKRNFTNSMSKLKDKEERLFDFFLDGNIDKPTFESKKAEIEIEKKDLQDSIDKMLDIDVNIAKTIENLIDIIGNSLKLFKNATPHNKRALLGLVLSDCYLDGKKLVYTLQKPFDKLFNQPDCEGWLKLDTDNLCELSQMSKSVDLYHKSTISR